jgi:hypothetical protein
MKDHTPNGVVVVVVATVIAANKLVIFLKGYLLLAFHIVVQK